MKHIVSIGFFVMLIGFSQLATAHGDHGVISGHQAVAIASKTIKQMTFKDFGFEPGKLTKEWKSVNEGNINVLNIIEGHYIVEASNPENDSKLYFQISPNGEVIDVSHKESF
ncbi:DUF6488 family protein [Kangiella shandongensis]|uniref:DUF6488 family protein n=1 Tax=Kangiella shandongensis TaxID=2763258 RepID=UPI001CBD3ED8|nr:DUF6488 family protein [Kangiella shandongensis]